MLQLLTAKGRSGRIEGLGGVESTQRHSSPTTDRNLRTNVHNRQNGASKIWNGLIEEASLRGAANISRFRVNTPSIQAASVRAALYSEEPGLRARLHQPIPIVEVATTTFHRVGRYCYRTQTRDSKDILQGGRLVDRAEFSGRIHRRYDGR
jgi:hypothetical protein